MFTAKTTTRSAEQAELLIRARRYEEAVALCNKEVRRGRATIVLRLLLSRALIALHENSAAVAELTECLSQDPACADAYRMLGQLALRHNEYPRAIQLLEMAARITPEDESLRFLLGVTRAMQRRGPPEESEDEVTLVTTPPQFVATPARLVMLPRSERAVRTPFWIALGVTCLLPLWSLLGGLRAPPAPLPEIAAAVTVPPPHRAAPPELAPPEPSGPPPGWTATLASDTWIHPLQGPVRRMPVRDSRVFGAERPGDRPAECLSGHCGVDLGEVWGEPVLAVHDGVVERVQRGPNADHGGLYVRLAHRGGTVLTEYFHLAAIPRSVQTGRAVKAGQVIGLLGDSGVRQSGPHLHFTVLVRPEKGGPEQYVDPQSLVALWPLWTPTGPGQAIVDASAAPGVPRAAAHGRKRKRLKASAGRRGAL